MGPAQTGVPGERVSSVSSHHVRVLPGWGGGLAGSLAPGAWLGGAPPPLCLPERPRDPASQGRGLGWRGLSCGMAGPAGPHWVAPEQMWHLQCDLLRLLAPSLSVAARPHWAARDSGVTWWASACPLSAPSPGGPCSAPWSVHGQGQGGEEGKALAALGLPRVPGLPGPSWHWGPTGRWLRFPGEPLGVGSQDEVASPRSRPGGVGQTRVPAAVWGAALQSPPGRRQAARSCPAV